MTDWRERRLGAHVRARKKRGDKQAQDTQTGSSPLILILAIRQKAREHGQEALDALIALASSASSEHVRVAAANAVLDRAMGKPLPGVKAAEADEPEEEGLLEVRWLGDDL
jgi:hypothetical protein